MIPWSLHCVVIGEEIDDDVRPTFLFSSSSLTHLPQGHQPPYFEPADPVFALRPPVEPKKRRVQRGSTFDCLQASCETPLILLVEAYLKRYEQNEVLRSHLPAVNRQEKIRNYQSSYNFGKNWKNWKNGIKSRGFTRWTVPLCLNPKIPGKWVPSKLCRPSSASRVL